MNDLSIIITVIAALIVGFMIGRGSKYDPPRELACDDPTTVDALKDEIERLNRIKSRTRQVELVAANAQLLADNKLLQTLVPTLDQREDANRYRYLRDTSRGLYRVEEERRGYRSTYPNAPQERWFEHVGWCVEGGDEHSTMDAAVDSARGVLNAQDTPT
jgi:hypothetical protein